MALTSPDNIWTPDSSDNYALTTDLAATADSIQDAITALRGNNAPTVRVANVAERNAALADHGTPTPDNPLIVFRADAGAGRELEYTTNGTLWHTLAAEDDTGWVNASLSSGVSGSFAARRVGKVIEVRGNGNVTISANSTTTIATFPAWANPSSSSRGVSVKWTATGLSEYGVLQADGLLVVRRSTAGSSTGIIVDGMFLAE